MLINFATETYASRITTNVLAKNKMIQASRLDIRK